jgi:hypothetical protein
MVVNPKAPLENLSAYEMHNFSHELGDVLSLSDDHDARDQTLEDFWPPISSCSAPHNSSGLPLLDAKFLSLDQRERVRYIIKESPVILVRCDPNRENKNYYDIAIFVYMHNYIL